MFGMESGIVIHKRHCCDVGTGPFLMVNTTGGNNVIMVGVPNVSTGALIPTTAAHTAGLRETNCRSKRCIYCVGINVAALTRNICCR